MAYEVLPPVWLVEFFRRPVAGGPTSVDVGHRVAGSQRKRQTLVDTVGRIPAFAIGVIVEAVEQTDG